MIVLEWLFITRSYCDVAEPWQLGFQDPGTPMMQGIMDLHHDIFFFLILILVFVSCPQKQGVRLRVPTRTPKKPNSALRKITKITVEHKELQDILGGWRKKAINLVQSISKEDKKLKWKEREIVHLLLKKKNTFVNVTDARGNKESGASAGCLGFKGRSRHSRYAAQATAEHVGRSAINPGLMKLVVMKVKGYTYFRKKKKVILSWRKGYNECKQSKGDPSKMKYIRDVTQLPHNGCRLPRKRRVQIVPRSSPFSLDNNSGKNLTRREVGREYTR